MRKSTAGPLSVHFYGGPAKVYCMRRGQRPPLWSHWGPNLSWRKSPLDHPVGCGDHCPKMPFNRPISAHFSGGLLKMAKFGNDLRQAIAEAIEETASGVVSEIATEHLEDMLGGVQIIEETRQVGAR